MENYKQDKLEIYLNMPKKKTVKEVPATIKITVKSMGRVFQSEAPTFEEAVDKIKISNGARSVSMIKIEKDGKEITKILNARYTSGLFGQGSPSLKAIHLKGVKMILGV